MGMKNEILVYTGKGIVCVLKAHTIFSVNFLISVGHRPNLVDTLKSGSIISISQPIFLNQG